ncbi:MAG: hypothetical protein ACYTFI_03260, partial [Planctomycetota bacterium]
IGKRTVKYVTETFDSGYVLKKIKPDFRIVVERKRELVEDPPGSGNVVPRVRNVERKVPIHVLQIEKADGSRKLELEYWPGGKPAGKTVRKEHAAVPPKGSPPKPKPEPKPKPKPKPKEGDLLSKLKKEMEGAPARGQTPEAIPDTAPGQKPRAPAAPAAPEGFKLVKGDQSAAKVLVPKNWAAGLELDDIINGRLRMWDVAADSVAVWGGSVPGSGMVLSDKTMPHAELADLIGRPTEGLSAEKIAGLACDALKKKSLESLAGAAARGENWSVSTKAGQPAAAFAMRVADQGGPLMVAKYFVLPPSRLYTVTFFCKAGDYEAQKGVFDKIVGTLDW